MKKIFMGVAAFALILAGCQNEEEFDSQQAENPNTINFTSTTSRAAISDLSTLMGSSTGFQVYANNPASTTAWFPGIDGTATYKYVSSNWGWSAGSPQWPTTTAGYPMNFYAFYPGTAGGFSSTATAATALSGAITVQNAPASQTDFLAAKASTASKPANGKLTLTFGHIMSKVDFGVIAGTGAGVFIQSLASANLKNAGTYNYITGSWGTPTGSDTYVYYGTYIPSGTGGTTVLPTFTPLVADNATVNPFYVGSHSNHLMLMPQTTTTWDKSTTVANAYIGVMYRISTLLDPDQVGYTSAATHPNYPGSGYTGPLFVKVGFPFAASSLTWNPAMGYTYNLQLGTDNASNGYYLDTFYYDNQGNKTNFPIPAGKTVGSPVADGTINFNVVVTPWNNQSDVNVN